MAEFNEEKFLEELTVRISENKGGRFIRKRIPIDDKGNGKSTTKVNEHLEAVILPERIMSFPSITMYSERVPHYKVFDFKKSSNDRIFFPRVQTHDIEGRKLNLFEKPYVSGNLVIEIAGAVPLSTFTIVLVVK